MKEFFSIEGPFMQFFGKLWDIILLSVVFCVCSIPIITFGMNCIALYYTVVKVYALYSGRRWSIQREEVDCPQRRLCERRVAFE